jgi:hydrogenase expression/formation protein HypC
MLIEKIEDNVATVDRAGVKIQADISLTPEAGVGDYILVHAGFAIEVLKPEEAQETLRLIQEAVESLEDDKSGIS